ncbi:MAG TPA: hypothetical protein VK163_13295 [Opitutaceae bacterium]|nr:hypothetical protein [Opitutaceae bacterium]
MKLRPIVLLLALIGTSTRVDAYSDSLMPSLDRLRQCSFLGNESSPMVGGRAVGYSGAPHEFFLQFPKVAETATTADLRAMLDDPSPVVRIMAAKCIIKKPVPALSSALDALLSDNTKVYVAPYGCTVTEESVGDVIKKLKAKPSFLEDIE